MFFFNRTSADVHMHNTCFAFAYQLMCGYFLKFHPRCSFHGIEDVFPLKAMSFLLNVWRYTFVLRYPKSL